MTIMTRRTLIRAGVGAAALGGVALRSTRARAAEFTLKMGADWPTDHPSSVEARRAADTLRERTGGRVDIQLFPNNILGGDTDMLSQLRSGAMELLAIPTGVLSTLVPEASINNTAFAFDTYDQVWRAMDGDLGAHVRAKIEKVNVVVMERIWDNGFRQITTAATPINALANLRGLKIRVPVSPIYTSMMRGLGSSPVSANINELYSALQTKVFDGQENTWSNIEFFKLYEVQKDCALTNHMWEGFWILGNRRALARLPQDLQATLAEVLNASALRQRVALADLGASARPMLEGKGMAFTTPDRAELRDALSKAGFYADWKRQFGDEAWALLEASTQKLA